MYTVHTLARATRLLALTQAYIDITACNSQSDQIIDRAFDRTGYTQKMSEGNTTIVSAKMVINEDDGEDQSIVLVEVEFDDEEGDEGRIKGKLYLQVKEDGFLYGDY